MKPNSHNSIIPQVVPAAEFFELVKTKQDFREWLAERIINYEMEEGVDFHIYLSVEACQELMKHESFVETDKLKALFENK